MSVIASTSEMIGLGVTLLTWTGLAAGDTATPVACGASADKTMQVYGTFDGETMTMQGSMLAASEFIDMSDPQGNSMAYTSADLEVILENPLYIRPSMSAGAGTTSLTVHVLMVRK